MAFVDMPQSFRNPPGTYEGPGVLRATTLAATNARQLSHMEL